MIKPPYTICVRLETKTKLFEPETPDQINEMNHTNETNETDECSQIDDINQAKTKEIW